MDLLRLVMDGGLKVNKRSLISIVIPAWNEHANLLELRPRLEGVIEPLTTKYDFEFILIDNHSEDATPALMAQYCADDSRWKYVRFSRNFGLEASFHEGIQRVAGDAVIFLFSDMQDPPELIPEYVERWESGFDVVYGTIKQRADGRFLEKAGALITHKLLNKLSGNVIPENAADFQLLSRNVIEAIKLCGERNRYFRGLVHSMGFNKCTIPFARQPRKNGETTMGLFFRAGYAITCITAFSTKPLEIISIIGFLLTMLSFLGSVVYTLSKFLTYVGIVFLPVPPLGWTTLVLVLLFFNGVNMMFLGVIGRYVSSIYAEVKQRPISVVEHAEGFK